MADSAQEKTEAATSRRRQEARKRGTVARSSDLTNSLVMLALLLALPTALASLSTGMLAGVRDALMHTPKTATMSEITNFTRRVGTPMIPGLAMIMGVCMTVGLAVNFAQVGIKASPEAMIPNFSKLNPLSGFKRLFSAQLGFEGLKALIKSIVFGYLAYSAVMSSREQYAGLPSVGLYEAISIVGGTLKTLGWRMVMAWAALAGLDYFFQRQQTEKQMRMTKEEVKREFKESEGSPEMKGARMRQRRKLKQKLSESVKSADVVITNPTHYAVAVKYDPGKSMAPIVVGKGADFLAARIREIAKEHSIPIVPNPPLARALYKQCEVGDPIPKELFQGVAEVLAYVYKVLNIKKNWRN